MDIHQFLRSDQHVTYTKRHLTKHHQLRNVTGRKTSPWQTLPDTKYHQRQNFKTEQLELQILAKITFIPQIILPNTSLS
jgi:hypothetical protein